MKFTTDVPTLKQPIATADSVIPARTTYQVAECVRIIADKNGVSFLTADSELDSIVTLPLKVKEHGNILVNSSRLNELIQSLRDGEVTFKTTDKLLTVVAKSGQYSFHIMPDEGRLELRRDFKPVSSFSLVTKDLTEAISSTMFAAMNGKNEFTATTGVLFDIKKDALVLVATDNRKLSSFSLNCGNESEGRITVPGKVLSLMLKYFSPEDEVSVSYSDTQIMFSTATVSLCSMLINVPFPNYEAITPKDNETLIKADRIELLSGARRAAIFTDKNKDESQISLTFSKDTITIRNDGADLGHVDEVVKCYYKGNEHTIGLNATAFAECLDRLDTDSVLFKINTKIKRPLLIYPVGKSANNQYMFLGLLKLNAKDE